MHTLKQRRGPRHTELCSLHIDSGRNLRDAASACVGSNAAQGREPSTQKGSNVAPGADSSATLPVASDKFCRGREKANIMPLVCATRMVSLRLSLWMGKTKIFCTAMPWDDGMSSCLSSCATGGSAFMMDA